MSLKDEAASVEKILGDPTATSARAVDAKKKERQAELKREGLLAERRLLVEEWSRVQGREEVFKEKLDEKFKKDPFLERSIEDSKKAIRTRLAQVEEALKGLAGPKEDDSGPERLPGSEAAINTRLADLENAVKRLQQGRPSDIAPAPGKAASDKAPPNK